MLNEIVTRLDRLARQHVLDAQGLSYPEFLVAMAVDELNEPTQVEVGDFLDMSKSLVSQRVADPDGARLIASAPGSRKPQAGAAGVDGERAARAGDDLPAARR